MNANTVINHINAAITLLETIHLDQADECVDIDANGELTEVIDQLQDIVFSIEMIHNKRKTKTVKNLMTGKDIEIAEDTPFCCDPSTETYWSM